MLDKDREIIIGKIKSGIILFLAALMVYQTGVLWFVNITNRNFLLNVFPILQQTTIPEGLEQLVIPWRIITIHGDGRFSAQYSNLTMTDSKSYGDMVLSHLLQKGRFVSAQSINYETLLTEAGYIYEYAFPMQAEWFTQGFNLRHSLLTDSGVTSFRKIIIRPPAYSIPGVHVFFLCENGYAYEFTVIPPESGGPSHFEHNIPIEAVGAYYLFTELPQGKQFLRYGEFVFNAIQVTNPYVDIHGGFSLDFIQGQVAGFFSNPAVIRPIVGNDVWVYRDVNTVVRYYAANVLEYINYRAIDRRAHASFESDFASAIQFLKRDVLVANETYLVDYREEDGQRVFYFNYVIGDTPLIMSQNWVRDFQLRYPIMITVSHGTVIRYRKLAFNFYIDKEIQLSARADFNNLMGRLGDDFTNVQLGYRIIGEDMKSLYWFVDERAFALP